MVKQRKRNFKKKNAKIKKPSSIFINALISILAVVCIFFVYHSIEDKIFPPDKTSKNKSLEEFLAENKNEFTEKTGEIIEVAVLLLLS